MHDDDNDVLEFTLDDDDTEFYSNDPVTEIVDIMDGDPVRSLYRAVIAQAVQDLKSNGTRPVDRFNQEKAEHWFFEGGKDFKEVCELAGWSPRWVRERLKEAQANGYRRHKKVTKPKRRRRRVTRKKN